MDGQQKIQKMNCPLIRIVIKRMILRNSGTGIMQYTESEAVQKQIFLPERGCQILPVIRQEGMTILIEEIMLETTAVLAESADNTEPGRNRFTAHNRTTGTAKEN